jgi:hypothetical protein
LKSGLSLSQANTDREQQLTDGISFVNQSVFDGQLTGALSYYHPLQNGELVVGTEASLRSGDLTTRFDREDGGEQQLTAVTRTVAVSPFVGYSRQGIRSNFSAGLRVSLYEDSVQDFVFEPRVNYELKAGNSRFLATAERISQLPLAPMMLDAPGEGSFAPVSNNLELGYGRSFGGVTTMLKAYFQYTAEDYAIETNGFLNSANNFLELYPFQVPLGTAATRRYGLELEAAGGRKTKGWYYRGSLSLVNAETEQADGSWADDRFNVDYIANLTLGREWAGEDSKQRDRTYGLNLALIAHGGERYGNIPDLFEPAPTNVAQQFFRPQDLSMGYVNSLGTYFRPDLRLYKTKVRTKTTTTLALDIQNVAGIENAGAVYYDSFLGRPNERFQLGLIPVLSYRITWR